MSERLELLRQEFHHLFADMDSQHVIVEFPEFFADDRKGYAAASTGALVKIAAVSGVLIGVASDRMVSLVLPSMWKGQLVKTVTKHRLILKWGLAEGSETPRTSHEWDAWGLGDWFGTKYLWK